MKTSKRSKPASAEVLAYREVCFSYGREEIICSASFTVRAGDYVAFIGPNGGGKTTLLKIGLGLLSGMGEVRLFKTPVEQFTDWHRVGYVPQRSAIEHDFPASVAEIVSLGGRHWREALEEMRITDLADRRASSLSGGQQQRVMLARALAGKPDLLALDEPSTGVDEARQVELYELLARLNKKGITVIVVTHDLSRVSKHVTKVACVNRQVVFHNSHEEFCAGGHGPYHRLSHVPGEEHA